MQYNYFCRSKKPIVNFKFPKEFLIQDLAALLKKNQQESYVKIVQFSVLQSLVCVVLLAFNIMMCS